MGVHRGIIVVFDRQFWRVVGDEWNFIRLDYRS